MKRKVIQLAGKTLVVSLPSSWTKKYSIKKGEELELSEEKNRIVISTSKLFKKEALEIDISDKKEVLYRVIGALYKAGYEEILVSYKSREEVDIIKQCLANTCLGFEIVEQNKKTLLIKSISSLHVEEFDNVMRRLFLSLLSIIEEAAVVFKEKDRAELTFLIKRDIEVNKNADFCRRLINMGYSYYKAPPLYVVAEQLEKLGDLYRDMFSHILNNKIELSNDFMHLYTQVSEYVRDFYTLFYNFDLGKANDFIKKYHELKVKARKANLPKEELQLFFYLNTILSTTYDMNGALLTLKL